jgi:phage-related protein
MMRQEERIPRTRLVFFQEKPGQAPLLDWLAGLPDKVRAKCRVRLERLAELGHELRRPEADLLRDGIYELRVGHRGQNYRMLYFFHGQEAAVLSHGLVKEQQVPPREIDLAITRKAHFTAAQTKHTYVDPPGEAPAKDTNEEATYHEEEKEANGDS